MTAQILRDGPIVHAKFANMALLCAYLAHHPDMVASIQLTGNWTTYPCGPSARIPHRGAVNGTLPDVPA